MKLCTFFLFFALSYSAHAATSFDVVLNNRAYASTVKAVFEARRIPFRFVAKAQPGVPNISVQASHARGCQARVGIESGSMMGTRSREQSMLFSSEARRFEKCKAIVAEMLGSTLVWF